MKIVQIDDVYIDLLRQEFPNAMDPKRFHRSHTRKYIGIIFTIGNFNYYAPFSSPKPRDYNSDGAIKKNNIFSLKIKKNDNGKEMLLGTIKLNNMIPVPMIYVCGYSFKEESDIKYANLVEDEYKWIGKNQSEIIKSARIIYNLKKHEQETMTNENKHIYDAILPFQKIEEFLIFKKLIK